MAGEADLPSQSNSRDLVPATGSEVSTNPLQNIQHLKLSDEQHLPVEGITLPIVVDNRARQYRVMQHQGPGVPFLFIVDEQGQHVSDKFNTLELFEHKDPKKGIDIKGLIGAQAAEQYALRPPTQEDPVFRNSAESFHDLEFRTDIIGAAFATPQGASPRFVENGVFVTQTGASKIIIDSQGHHLTKGYHEFFVQDGRLYGHVGTIVEPVQLIFAFDESEKAKQLNQATTGQLTAQLSDQSSQDHPRQLPEESGGSNITDLPSAETDLVMPSNIYEYVFSNDSQTNSIRHDMSVESNLETSIYMMMVDLEEKWWNEHYADRFAAEFEKRPRSPKWHVLFDYVAGNATRIDREQRAAILAYSHPAVRKAFLTQVRATPEELAVAMQTILPLYSGRPSEAILAAQLRLGVTPEEIELASRLAKQYAETRKPVTVSLTDNAVVFTDKTTGKVLYTSPLRNKTSVTETHMELDQNPPKELTE